MAQKPPRTPDVLAFPGLKLATAWEPPRPLGSHGRELWDQVTREFRFDDIAGRELLAQCCEALDRVETMRKQTNDDGEAMVGTEGQAKPHPLLQAELAGRGFITRTLLRLGLNYEPVKAPGRPPGSAA
jgi:hypothetical protein